MVTQRRRSVVRQPAFGVDGGRTARSRRGDRLPVVAIDHITTREDAIQAGPCRRVGDRDVALVVERELLAKTSLRGLCPIATNTPVTSRTICDPRRHR